MKQSVLLSVVGFAVFTAAHGIVSNLKIGSEFFGGYNPFQDQYEPTPPQRIVWAFPTAGNGPVVDVSSRDIVCNKGATAAPLTAPAAAGDKVTFFWTPWPHPGPVMTYLANCGGECSKVDPTKLEFFKIDHGGLSADGTWASDKLIANNNSWTVTIPSDIVSGNYILRHEILGLHEASTKNGAQFYPMCANLKISGPGSASPAGVQFPGAYKATDPGILVNIYDKLESYEIPGPAVYTSGRGGGNVNAGNSTSPAYPKTTFATVTLGATTAQPAATTAPGPGTGNGNGNPRPDTGNGNGNPSPGTGNGNGNGSPRLGTGNGSRNPGPGTGNGNGTASKTSEEVNKCLDEVNACIRKAQSPSGGTVDFSACEAQRAACY